jgi:AcrR family transcriptional regulator
MTSGHRRDPGHGRHRGGSGADRPADKVAEQVAERVAAKVASKAERVAEKVAGKLDESAVRQERAAAKAAQKLAALDRVAQRLGGAAELWTRPEPASRRPRFTRDEIAAAAMRIADDEGFDALSMRRLAVELGAGTMTLYHYVRTKDELLALVADAVMAEVVLPDEQPVPTAWDEAMRVIATRTRAALRRHPWVLDIIEDPPLGPNRVRHFDQSLQAVASLPLDLAGRLDVVSAVDEYVFGYTLMERNDLASGGAPDPEMLDYVAGLLETDDYPQLRALVEARGLEQIWTDIETTLRDPDRFERNLDRLLDGVAASVTPTASGS